MEYKTIKINNFDTEKGTFYGYASIFNVEDSYNDIVLAGAFKDSLILKNTKDIKMFWQHNQKMEIGKYIDIHEDQIGLFVEGQIDIVNNYKNYSLVKNNFVNGLSIGYKADKFKFDKKGRRILEKINLLEISLVKFPANKLSNITYCI